MLRNRRWIEEMTASGAVPAVVRPFAVLKKARPNLIALALPQLRKKKKRLIKRFSKIVRPELQSRI